jgi:hypothetical protein
MRFAIFEDLVKNTSSVKIHLQSCHHHTMHKETETTRWHKCDNFDDAEILAKRISTNNKKGYRLAKCCTVKNLNWINGGY